MMEGGREERPENQEFLKKRVGIEYIDLSTPPETLEKNHKRTLSSATKKPVEARKYKKETSRKHVCI